MIAPPRSVGFEDADDEAEVLGGERDGERERRLRERGGPPRGGARRDAGAAEAVAASRSAEKMSGKEQPSDATVATRAAVAPASAVGWYESRTSGAAAPPKVACPANMMASESASTAPKAA